MTAHSGPLRFGRWEATDARRGFGYRLGQVVWGLAIIVALVLLIGVALVQWRANPGNTIVHEITRAGSWLATPFHGVFDNSDPRDRLTENWVLAAGVYLVGGRLLAWLIGR
jgi:hypothetical protein